jgi:hypothetical protein
MEIIDGHSHLFQTIQPVASLKKSVNEIKEFDIKRTLAQLDKLGISKVQTMAQEMTRVFGSWLGSNELSADLQCNAPERIIAYGGVEPIDPNGAFNKARLEQMRTMLTEKRLKGMLLSPHKFMVQILFPAPRGAIS